jgi:hypothetical protein
MAKIIADNEQTTGTAGCSPLYAAPEVLAARSQRQVTHGKSETFGKPGYPFCFMTHICVFFEVWSTRLSFFMTRVYVYVHVYWDCENVLFMMVFHMLSVDFDGRDVKNWKL